MAPFHEAVRSYVKEIIPFVLRIEQRCINGLLIIQQRHIQAVHKMEVSPNCIDSCVSELDLKPNNFADKFSQQLVPINFLMSGLVYLITRDLNRALNMLIIDYSCGVRQPSNRLPAQRGPVGVRV